MSILTVVHLLWIAIATLIVTRRTRTPASAGVWVLLIALLPLVGTLLYLLAGWHTHTRSNTPTEPIGGEDPLQTLITRNCGSHVARNNRVTLLHNGNNAFTALIASLQRASRSIHMEYYIIRDDRIGRTISEILMRKARAGVEVRVIYDAVGSWRLGRLRLNQLRKAGAEVRPYAPLRFPWFTHRANRRNHRKIVVTDGRTAYLGGINIAKYYLDGNSLGQWRDEHLRIEGDAVADLQRLFIADWRRTGGASLDPARYIAHTTLAQPLPLQIAWSEEGSTRHTLLEAFLTTIYQARHTLRLSSPYFMPPPGVLEALRIAAHRGVRTVVMIPTCSDSPFTDLVSDSYIDDLLDAGVELYRYDNGFLHAKVLIADERTASVGTANMDYRSLQDNLEVTAFLFDPMLIAELVSTFDDDLRRCVRVDAAAWRRRPAWRRIAGDVLRLTAPLL